MKYDGKHDPSIISTMQLPPLIRVATYLFVQMLLSKINNFVHIKKWVKHSADYEILNTITLTSVKTGCRLNIYKFMALC